MELIESIIYIPILSAFLTFLMIKLSQKTGIFIDDIDKTHGLHKKATPRSGGIAIYLSSIFVMSNPLGVSLYIASLPIFLAGFFEDLLKNIPPKIRFIFMALSAFLGIVLLNAIVFDIGYIKFHIIFALLFTIIGVVGIVNAVNLIDGLNGLASGVAIFTFLSFAYVSYIYNDVDILFVSLVLAMATAGFFVFNFPKGLIFLGDSGSYFLGFMLAELSILMVNRHPEISPWFPLVLLIYPVWETLFSILRRKLFEKRSSFAPDNNHLHCILCKKINSNPISSIFLLLIVFGIDIIAVLFKENTQILTITALIFAISYTFFYILFNLNTERVEKIRKMVYKLIYAYK
ncbi:MAG: undecaprenyl/decaprenyl-phosphate alpha-N-acetylglucosaminyl 1-phosphate transferase [Aquificae bacterium]|nr:undecaprenyl/decaprenyl-phosphate alpha-N-acetylglucosaminyl 1-phosphate transferase [Aquificota bacterium]